MGKQSRQKREQRRAQHNGLVYPYDPHIISTWSLPQKIFSSPEIEQEFRAGIGTTVCINTQAITDLIFPHKDALLPTNAIAPLPSCFLYTNAPQTIFDRESGTFEKRAGKELSLGVHCFNLNVDRFDDPYHLVQTLFCNPELLPEQEPKWFEQTRWISTFSLFLEVPWGQHARCVGPAAIMVLLFDDLRQPVTFQGQEIGTVKLTHPDTEEAFYWLAGAHMQIGPVPGAEQTLRRYLTKFICWDIYVALLTSSFLNSKEVYLQLKDTEQYIHASELAESAVGIYDTHIRNHQQAFQEALHVSNEIAEYNEDDFLESLLLNYRGE